MKTLFNFIYGIINWFNDNVWAILNVLLYVAFITAAIVLYAMLLYLAMNIFNTV
jgi:hypothetical protein